MTTVPEKAHDELGPSAAHRWMHCAGSVEAERGMPDNSNAHSIEGTAAHALAEVAYQRNRHPELWVGDTVETVVITQDIADNVETYVDVLRDYTEGADIVRIERRLTLPREMNPPAPMGGTCDAWFFYAPTNRLRVVDLKFGRGVVVEADHNPQLQYYAVLAWLDLRATSKHLAESVREIELVIVQPRAFHPDGPIRTFTLTLHELRAFARELILAARRAMVPGAARTPGDWCRFCKAKLSCAEFRNRALAVAKVEFGPLVEGERQTLPDMASLTPDQLGNMLRGLDLLEAFVKTGRQYVMGELEAGRPVTGFALKPKRANRAWVDDASVLTFGKAHKLKQADLFTKKLVSPAQLEKVLKAVGLTLPEELVVRESSGYTLTTDDDPKAVVPATVIPALEPIPEIS